jgi:glycerol-3-phosphate dehydrogenase (NAD(P)+)
MKMFFLQRRIVLLNYLYETSNLDVAKTVEGVASSSAVVELAHRVGVEVPVIEAVADVVAGTITPKQALERLMAITTKAENFIR